VGTANTASSVQGGYPDWPVPGTNLRVRDVWRQCANSSVPYENCVDRFRIELTKTSLHLFANGYPVMLIDGLYASNPATGADNRVPDSWFSNGVYVYATSWINNGMHHATRFYWDRIAVNPHSGSGFAAPSASPTFCLGQPGNTCPEGSSAAPPTNTPVPAATATRTPTPPATNTPVPNATATRTPVPNATATPTPGANPSTATTVNFNNLSNPNRALTGQYPSGVIDWGSGAWYLSGPYSSFRTNSISFNGAGPTSASFSLPTARRVLGLDAVNGGTTSSTISLACSGNPTVQTRLSPGQSATIRTNWTGTCSKVSISSTNGWYTNFDNIVVQ
jgi:hypothetical protein